MSKRTIVKGIQITPILDEDYSSFKNSYRKGEEFICVSSVSNPLCSKMNIGEKICISFKFGARKRLIKGALNKHPELGYIVVAST